ncbi:MAG TPA: SDR family NAD(P)-dependent oxidoreductase, partial [Lacipirellulaceae bacterium]|nr:SDR family NAD(P)-dependent oxidoreductase [Lacipirellulaceae bacterium]
MPPTFDLSGKHAIVTGASRGLGQTFARALAQAGADVVVPSRDVAALQPFCDEIAALGRRAVPL